MRKNEGQKTTADLLAEIAGLQVDEGFAPNGDIRIHYRAYGAGPAIVFQHGFPDNELSFMHQIVEFARDHLVVTPTLRGYPPSSVPDDAGRYTVPELSTDVGAVLDHLGLERPVVAGHDWGGVAVQAFSLLNPGRVESLVLMNTPILQPFINLANSDAEQQRLSEYTLPYLAYKEGDDKNIDHVVRFIRDTEWRRRVSAYLAESPMHGMLNYYKAGFPAPPYDAPPPDDPSMFVYRVPALVIWGLADPYFSLKHLNDLWDWFSESYRFVSVPGAGHWVHQDAPLKVDQEIRSWLQARAAR